MGRDIPEPKGVQRYAFRRRGEQQHTGKDHEKLDNRHTGRFVQRRQKIKRQHALKKKKPKKKNIMGQKRNKKKNKTRCVDLPDAPPVGSNYGEKIHDETAKAGILEGNFLPVRSKKNQRKPKVKVSEHTRGTG